MTVKTTCARRIVIESEPPPDSNSELRSTVATPSSIETSMSCVPSGIAVETPAAASTSDGPASSASSAARATAGVDSAVRGVLKSSGPSSIFRAPFAGERPRIAREPDLEGDGLLRLGLRRGGGLRLGRGLAGCPG